MKMQSLGTPPAATVPMYVQWNLWGWCKAQGFSWKLSVHHPSLLLHIETLCRKPSVPYRMIPSSDHLPLDQVLKHISCISSVLQTFLLFKLTQKNPRHRQCSPTEEKKKTKVTVSKGLTTDLHCSLIWSLLLMSYYRLNVLKPMCVECLSNKLRGCSGENKHRQAGSSSSGGSTVARHFSP